jgi:Putative restriction endonuclease
LIAHFDRSYSELAELLSVGCLRQRRSSSQLPRIFFWAFQVDQLNLDCFLFLIGYADLRWSYVLWQEAIAPFIVVELLTPGVDGEELVESLDRNQVSKWGLYERVLRVPYYVVFDWRSGYLWMFCLQGGRYVELDLSGQGFG